MTAQGGAAAPAVQTAGNAAIVGSGGTGATQSVQSGGAGGGTPSAGASGSAGAATHNPSTAGASGGGSGVGGSTQPANAGTPGGDAGTASTPLADTQALIPHESWTCGKPAGIPGPENATLVFQAELQLGEVYDIGETQYGQRQLAEIKGGMLTGPKINAQVMDRGLDWQLTLSNGAVEVEQVTILQTGDGAAIYVRNCGTAPDTASDVRIVADFEAPSGGAYDFLNTGDFVGTRKLDIAKKTLSWSLYDVSGMAVQTDSVRVNEPAGVPDQTWDCKVAQGTQGALVYMESVGIGAGSVAVGASKRGTRNIIPITGGTTTGRIQGDVLSGGADYQLFSDAFYLDARYTLHTHDGELIIVRNCGPVGALVPVFETRVAGPYAWLNENHWLSSDPGVGAGVVNLTIYEAK